jgi:general secretion pathway protein A
VASVVAAAPAAPAAPVAPAALVAPAVDSPAAPVAVAAIAPHDAPPSYLAHYGLCDAPFALSTDPKFFYHSTPHDRVAQRLLTAIRNREGLFVLTGDIGTGKTTLCRAVIEQLDRRTLTSFVSDPFVSAEELLKTILADFGVMSREELARGPFATRHDLSTALQSFIESLAPLQASAVVIIDEAQNLPSDVLEQVRILSDTGSESGLLQMVLVGQPGLIALLRRREHRSIDQRVSVRCELEALPDDEIGEYVGHRLAVASTATSVPARAAHPQFTGDAIDLIAHLSLGLPRVVNLLCDRALARAADASARSIGVDLIEIAAEDLDIGEAPSAVRGALRLAAAVIAFVLLALLGAASAAWVFHEAAGRSLTIWKAVPAAPQQPVAQPPRN